MPKKKGKSESNIQGKDNFHRMNYLYQAAHHVLATPGMRGDLSAYYSRLMCAVAKKGLLKIEPDIKRNICKGCYVLLQPGVSARVRLRRNNVVWTCLRCGTIKRFPTKMGFKLWIEKEGACVDVMQFPTVLSNYTQKGCNQTTASDENPSLSGVIVDEENRSFSSTHNVDPTSGAVTEMAPT